MGSNYRSLPGRNYRAAWREWPNGEDRGWRWAAGNAWVLYTRFRCECPRCDERHWTVTFIGGGKGARRHLRERGWSIGDSQLLVPPDGT